MNKQKPRQTTKTPVKAAKAVHAKVQPKPKVAAAKSPTLTWLAAMPKPIRIVVTIIVVLLVIFLGRGWVRSAVVPKSTGAFYRHGLIEAYNAQVDSLNNPFKQLGVGSASEDRSCNLQQAQGFHEEVDCIIGQSGYTELPATGVGMATTIQTANTLTTALQQQGWTGSTNGVTLDSLITGISEGKDYSADAYYQKVINHDDCVFDTFIAYANPQPPAIRVTFTCDRTVNVFGTPAHEFYNSTKGHFVSP